MHFNCVAAKVFKAANCCPNVLFSRIFALVNVESRRRYAEMRRILCVAEKNDAAKNIANILSKGTSRKREGLSKFNKIYEFDFNSNVFGSCKMVMTSVSGHLANLDFSPDFRKWHSCSPVDLFAAPIVTKYEESSENIKKTLEREARNCSALIIWTDCDREGESIGFQIIKVCKAINRTMDVFRAKFSEITSTSIFRAVNHLERPDKRLAEAVDVRRELDLRIGAAFTRYQTLQLQQNVLKAAKILLSYGSCQFPTLGFVVERFKEIEDFVPQKFWYLIVKDKRDGIDVDFKWERVRNFDEDIVLAIYCKMLQTPPEAVVTSVTTKPKSKWRPQPMDTVQLEKIASKKLKIDAKRTMQIAEKLYQQGFISYPRTETNIFPPDLNLRHYVELQLNSYQWGDFASRLLNSTLNPRNGKKTDNAHPPIHPTKYADNLNGDEAKIYELITRHFLACLSKDAVGSETTIKIEINEEVFTLNGLVVLERNYLDVYPYEKWSGKEIPRYNLHDKFMPKEILMNDGTTTAPPLLTEADLISLMEKHGIGTDATHAEHIETIKSRKYVGETPDRKFVPGRLGIGLIEGYSSMQLSEDLSKPHLRANLEKQLQEICNGSLNPGDVLRNQLNSYKQLFINAKDKYHILENKIKTYCEGQSPEDISNIPPKRN
ncbi:DNA topoisomerase 3-alpha-like protein [Leptotrombidium deliense]|uniref:DNA topoisomerase n=1 Tax=Leptotrombidium deliense TaxID=299467 RepID=A0A443SLN3_9ACAR|nr:DNA topoisomerase 3-alpha-like protein [Leptotrombidium deliense]